MTHEVIPTVSSGDNPYMIVALATSSTAIVVLGSAAIYQTYGAVLLLETAGFYGWVPGLAAGVAEASITALLSTVGVIFAATWPIIFTTPQKVMVASYNMTEGQGNGYCYGISWSQDNYKLPKWRFKDDSAYRFTEDLLWYTRQTGQQLPENLVTIERESGQSCSGQYTIKNKNGYKQSSDALYESKLAIKALVYSIRAGGVYPTGSSTVKVSKSYKWWGRCDTGGAQISENEFYFDGGGRATFSCGCKIHDYSCGN